MRAAIGAFLWISVTGSVAHAGGVGDWTIVGEPGVRFSAVSAASGGDWLGVGSSGLVARFHAGAWRLETVPTSADLVDVWIAPTGDEFIVGRQGVVVRKPHGGEWLLERQSLQHRPDDDTSPELHSVVGTTARDVWVTGDRGAVFHFDGSAWHSVRNMVDNMVQGLNVGPGGVAGITPTGVVRLTPAGLVHVAASPSSASMVMLQSNRAAIAVGGGITRYDGRNWVMVHPDHPDAVSRLISIGGVIVAIGESAFDIYERGQWTAIPYDGPALAALVRTPDGFEAVTYTGARVSLAASGYTVRPGFSVEGRVCPGDEVEIEDQGFVHRVLPDGVHGRFDPGSQARCEAVAAIPESTFDVRSSFQRDGETLAIGEETGLSSVYRSDGHAWSVLADPWTIGAWPGAPEFLAGSPRAGGDFWIGGSQYLIHVADGHFRRYVLHTDSEYGGLHGARHVGDAFYAFGGSKLWRWTGEYFVEEKTPGGEIVDVRRDGARILALQARVSSRRDAGYFGRIESDGSLAAGLSGLEFGPIRAAWGASASDVFALAGSRVVHFDGHAWAPIRTYSDEEMHAIEGSNGAVFSVGELGRTLVSRPEGLWPRASRTHAGLYGLRVRSAREAYAAGPAVILRWEGERWVSDFTSPERDTHGREISPVDIRVLTEWNGKPYALARGGIVLMRDDSGWHEAPADDAFASLRTLEMRSESDSYDTPSEDTSDTGASSAVAEQHPAPVAPAWDYERSEQRIEPCAVLTPRAGRALVVSCETNRVALFDGTHWSAYVFPTDLGLNGGTCIPGDGCYLFTRSGALRADPAGL